MPGARRKRLPQAVARLDDGPLMTRKMQSAPLALANAPMTALVWVGCRILANRLLVL